MKAEGDPHLQCRQQNKVQKYITEEAKSKSVGWNAYLWAVDSTS